MYGDVDKTLGIIIVFFSLSNGGMKGCFEEHGVRDGSEAMIKVFLSQLYGGNVPEVCSLMRI